jgi:glycyl-tRNA synthetase beta chain
VPDFLLELFSEEIPARMQAAAADQLRARFEALLADAGLSASGIEVHATPRRLALLAHGVPAASAAMTEERRGPRVDAPEAAIAGFLKSTGLRREALEERDTGKGVFLYAVIARAGRPASAILAERLPGLIADFGWPKSMRWEASGLRWVRPLRGVVALLDREVVPFEVAGLRAGRATWGHRFMGGRGPFEIASPATYADQLHSSFVILSADARAAIIGKGAARAAQAAGLMLVEDEALAAENAGLTEWPVPLLGRFDPAYLSVPREIIELTMRTNQKYFACVDADGALAPAFVCVANLEAPDGGKHIVAGNERVLSARLSDARFFWEQDVKVPLEEQAKKLSGILFHEKLGTMAGKVKRVARLARWLVETYPTQFPGAAPDTVERAARLARADLVTGTVGEFPELQGIIGGHIAQAQGEKPGVVEALRQHYAPVPVGCVPVAVALADRLDTIAHFFGIGEAPTGSKDPFAIRRAALNIVAILTTNGYRLGLEEILRRALPPPDTDSLAAFQSLYSQTEDPTVVVPRVVSDVMAFFADRLKVQQREAGVRPDVIDAVFALGGEDDLVRLLARVKALQAFIETEDGANLLVGYRRAANILKAEEKKDGRAYAFDASIPLSRYIGETEKNLAALFVPAQGAASTLFFDEADAFFAREDFEGAMAHLASLRAPVDRFFEDVLVNDPDPETRARRLSLLAAIRDAMHRVADFSRIEG